MENTEVKKEKVVDIFPLKKGKRMLVFLGDFFINFMLSFLLFVVACLPIGKAITRYNARNDAYTDNLVLRADILYENQIIFNSGEVDKTEIVYNTSFTYYVYMSYFSLDEVSPEHVKYPQYGHKTENDVFRHYFIDILGDSEKYYSLFDHYNEKYSYFVRTDSVIVLKDDVKTEIATYYDTSDHPTSLCETYMARLENSLFYPMMSETISLIEKNDLTNSGGASYNKACSQIKNFENYVNYLALGTSLTALLLSTSILYLLIPLVNKSHKTATMAILKIERIDFTSLNIASKGKTVLSFVYHLFFEMLISFFVPIGLLTIYEIFNISLLFVFAILSIALILASFVFILFNKFNRSLIDFSTGTIMVTSDTLDEIYRSKGYDI